MRVRWHFAALCAASLLNILPILVYGTGIDILYHHVNIQCFAQQFWQGDLLPRWCFAANGGLGIPNFLFYFPLPYHIAALLYPLTSLGLSIEHIYALSVFAATLATAFTARLWLKDIVGPGIATLGAILLLFLPYRMELLLFRSAYAELWAMAFAPLAFYTARRVALGVPRAGFLLAAALLALMLCHIPAILGVLLAMGVMFTVQARNKKAYVTFGIVAISALLIAAFFLLPSAHFMRYMLSQANENPSWPNDFISMEDVRKRGRLLIGIGLTALALAGLGACILLRRKKIEAAVWREAVAWLGIGIAAFLLTTPATAPLWNILNTITPIGMPRRMMMVPTFAVVFLAAVCARFLANARQLRTWKGDCVMLLAFLGLAGGLYINVMDEERSPDKAINMRCCLLGVYSPHRPMWLTLPNSEIIAFTRAHCEHPKQLEQIEGTPAQVRVISWGWDGISLEIDTHTPATIRLFHRYFPTWKLSGDVEGVTLTPETPNDLMLLHVLAGKRTVHIRIAPEWELVRQSVGR